MVLLVSDAIWIGEASVGTSFACSIDWLGSGSFWLGGSGDAGFELGSVFMLAIDSVTVCISSLLSLTVASVGSECFDVSDEACSWFWLNDASPLVDKFSVSSTISSSSGIVKRS